MAENAGVSVKSKEKDVTLAVALKFGKLITQHCPSVKVIYTRTDDATVEVYRRAEIANANKADLLYRFTVTPVKTKLPTEWKLSSWDCIKLKPILPLQKRKRRYSIGKL